MASEWRETTLDQLGRIVTGKTPPSSRPDYFGGDIPFVTPTDFDGRRIIETTGRYLTEAGADSVSARIPAGAVMVSCIGSDMGKAAIAGRDCVTNQQINSVIVAGQDDPLFVYYNLSTRKAEIRGAAGGSAQPILNKSAFGRLEIQLPPPQEQRAIAHILGTLDDKIELNRRMSETLEAMARALFKSWFVDFDPVRAKIEGHDPGLPDEIAALFPDSLDDSEHGEIPTGWTRQGLGEWVETLSGGTPSKKNPDLWSGPVPWISPKAMTSIHADEAEEHVTDEAIGNGTRLAPARSTLVMVRGMGLHQEVRVSQAQRDVAFNQDVKAFVPSKIEPDLLLFALLDAQQDLLGRVDSAGHGTGRLPTEILLAWPILMPDEKTQKMLARPFSNLNRRIALLREERRTLAILRDALLPNLISGALRLDDPERLLRRAAG